jgi:phosphinothricin acetyltransferase
MTRRANGTSSFSGEAARVDYRIDRMRPIDWDEVRAIYLEGIATGYATFETDPGTWEKWDGTHLADHRFVAHCDCFSILGWAALSPVSNRPVYAGVVEVSVYVAGKFRGEGVGRALMKALIASAEEAGIWTLQAAIFPENRGSLALHFQCGFREVGRREKLGRLYGKWHDVLLLERRSKTVD